VIEILRGVVHDPATFILVLAFWARWERWKRHHVKQHDELKKLIPHEVTEHG
jgi:hypothetical protein